jgi:osmotically-inducible protein OsmY
MKFFPKESDSLIRTVGMLIGGLGLGAALMYVLDPERGKRRRALARDKAVRAVNRAGDRLGARSRDWRNRARGVAAQVKSMARPEMVDDAVLEERVRAELGRAVSNPGPIEVTALAGDVTLSGPGVMSELDDLLSAVRGVPGVANVENRLEMYESAGDIPPLQVERAPRSKKERVLDRWEPAKAES